jgi:hypothetical protein
MSRRSGMLQADPRYVKAVQGILDRALSDPSGLPDSENVFVRWGVAPGPALWPGVLRILFVLDARVETSTGPGCFGLGYVLETLRDPSFAWWVRFDVQVVRRDDGSLRLHGCPEGDTNYTAPGRNPGFPIFDFRFTDASFNINDYDQVWFFGDYPSNADGPVDSPDFAPLEDAELKLLAEWMDRGGGVFATGDHYNLGASMCSRIPRVRTMRKWTVPQGVPTQDGDRRNQTLQHAPGYIDLWEGDTTPQPIEPVYQQRSPSILARSLVPHPLLCTPTGPITYFPDHMHEGEVIEDNEVELDLPLDIPGYGRSEYPFEGTDALPVGTAAAIAPGFDIRPRPRPHVVAHGHTTNAVLPQAEAHQPAGAMTRAAGLFTKRFGLVSAYDGDRVGIGRVVVDSTWHHWFSYNLHGFKSDNPPMYRLMQAYYRNVALWLATPAQRQTLLFAATWGTVVSDPMAFPAAPRRSIWAVGQRAVEMMSRTVSPCTLFELVASSFNGLA